MRYASGAMALQLIDPANGHLERHQLHFSATPPIPLLARWMPVEYRTVVANLCTIRLAGQSGDARAGVFLDPKFKPSVVHLTSIAPTGCYFPGEPFERASMLGRFLVAGVTALTATVALPRISSATAVV